MPNVALMGAVLRALEQGGRWQSALGLHYIALHYVTLHYVTLHYTKLHCISFHYTTLHCITLHCIPLQAGQSESFLAGFRDAARDGALLRGAAPVCARALLKHGTVFTVCAM